MRWNKYWVLGLLVFTANSFAAPMPARYDATTKKAGRYIDSGFFAGGSKLVTSTVLKDVRRGPQEKGERIVFDFEGMGSKSNEVPYFQVHVNPESGRVVVSVWSDVSYDYDNSRIQSAFRKSGWFKGVNFMPRVEDGLATIELELKTNKKPRIEAFYLSHPARIILDIL